MFRFHESLTEEEKLLLRHMTMQHLDSILPDDWDGSQKSTMSARKDNWYEIGGEQINVQGLSKANYSLSSYQTKGLDLPYSHETISSLCNLANHVPRKKRVAEETAQESQGVMLVNQTMGHHVLFDYPVTTQYCMTLSFSDAEVHESRVGEKAHIMDGKENLEVLMAPEQFVRFVRSSNVAIPCTISRYAGYLLDSPPMDHLEAVKLSVDVEASVNEITKELVQVADEVCELLESGKVNSKKKVRELEGLIDKLNQRYEEAVRKTADVQMDAIDGVRETYIHRLVEQVEREVQALPAAKREGVLKLLGHTGEDL